MLPFIVTLSPALAAPDAPSASTGTPATPAATPSATVTPTANPTATATTPAAPPPPTATATATVAPTAPDEGPRLVVLAIGTGSAAGPSGGPVYGATSASWFASGFSLVASHWADHEVRVLAGASLSGERVLRTVGELSGSAGPDDVLILFVSTEANVAEGRLVLGEAATLGVDALRAELGDAAFGHVVVFNDLWSIDEHTGHPVVPDLRIAGDEQRFFEFVSGSPRTDRTVDPIPTYDGSNFAYYLRSNLASGDSDGDGSVSMKEVIEVTTEDLRATGYGGGGIVPTTHGEVPALVLSDIYADDGSSESLQMSFPFEDLATLGATPGPVFGLFAGASGGPMDPALVEDGVGALPLQSRGKGTHGHWGVLLGLRGPWWLNPAITATAQRVHATSVTYGEGTQLTDVRPGTRWIVEVREAMHLAPQATWNPYVFARGGLWSGEWTAAVEGVETYRFRSGPLGGPWTTGAGLGVEWRSLELSPGMLGFEAGADQIWDDAPVEGFPLVVRGSVLVLVPM